MNTGTIPAGDELGESPALKRAQLSRAVTQTREIGFVPVFSILRWVQFGSGWAGWPVLPDEEERFTGLFVHRRPGFDGFGRGQLGSFRYFDFCGLRFRFAVDRRGPLSYTGGKGVGEADEFAMGAEPGAFVGGDLALDAGEKFGGGSFGEHDVDEGGSGRFGEHFVDEAGFKTLEALLMPVGMDHGVYEEAVHDSFRLVGSVVRVGEGVVVGGVFAGEADGSGIDAVFQGVEARDGLALGGAGSSGK
jgi:hypothetical protein